MCVRGCASKLHVCMFPIAGFSCLEDEKWPLTSQRGIDLDEYVQVEEIEQLAESMSVIPTLFFFSPFYITPLFGFLS